MQFPTAPAPQQIIGSQPNGFLNIITISQKSEKIKGFKIRPFNNEIASSERVLSWNVPRFRPTTTAICSAIIVFQQFSMPRLETRMLNNWPSRDRATSMLHGLRGNNLHRWKHEALKDSVPKKEKLRGRVGGKGFIL